MASYTPNINLKKPTTSEMYNVLDWNDNSDKIDTAIGNLNSQIATVSKINQYSKSTGSTAGNLIFETSENRYNALVFLVDNNAASNSAIYSVIYKQDVTNNVVRLAGSGNSVTVEFSTGKITVACGSWSTAVVLSTTTMS